MRTDLVEEVEGERGGKLPKPHPLARREGQGTAATRTCEERDDITTMTTRHWGNTPDVLDPGEEGGERVEDEAEEKTLYLTLPSIHSL